MKISDYVFRDMSLFLDTFVEPDTVDLCSQLVKELDVYKWGISEPGRKGKIIACCDRSGDTIRLKDKIKECHNWTVFFNFAPGISIAKKGELLDVRIVELWRDFNHEGVCNGFEVRLNKSGYLLELINGISEI